MMDGAVSHFSNSQGGRRGGGNYILLSIFIVFAIFLSVGPHPPNGYNPPLREEGSVHFVFYYQQYPQDKSLNRLRSSIPESS
jgi:hypothetical protein